MCHGTWAHLNGILHKSLPPWVNWPVFLSSVARQRLDNNVNAAANNTHQQKTIWTICFLSTSVVKKEIRRLFFCELLVYSVLPVSSRWLFLYCHWASMARAAGNSSIRKKNTWQRVGSSSSHVRSPASDVVHWEASLLDCCIPFSAFCTRRQREVSL